MCFHAAVHLSYSFLCSVSGMLQNKFVINFRWGVEKNIFFLISYVVVLSSALKISTSSASVKHERKRPQSASWTAEKKLLVPY